MRGPGERVGSVAGVRRMLTTFQRARITVAMSTALVGRAFRRWDETVREVAARIGCAGSAPREVTSQKR